MLESLQHKLGRTLSFLRGQARIKEADLDKACAEIKDSLLDADVDYDVVETLLRQIRQKALGAKIPQSLNAFEEFLRILSKELLAIFGETQPFEAKGKPPFIILMSGLQGSGKTTSSGKLAYFLKKKLKRSPLLVSVDITRPAAMEQLERLAKDAGVDYFSTQSQKPVERAREALKYASTYGNDCLIVDTAGRLSIDDSMMAELELLHRELKPQATLYVADAMSGQQGLKVAKGFAERVGLSGAVLTKTDGDSRGGIALSMRHALQVPLLFVGTGEKLDGLEPFHPDRWVSRILGMGDLKSLFEKAEVAFEEKAPSKDQMKRLMKGGFNFMDFQEQMKMLSKMGSMGSLLGMIPGMGAMAARVNQADIDKKLKKVNAMINSMTLKERMDPDLLNGDRRRRIAKGSGTTVEDLNAFVREFHEMQKMMKRMGGMKGAKGLSQMFR